MNKFFIFMISLLFCVSTYAQSLPEYLMTKAISESIIYDADFDYVKLKKFTSLKIYPDGFRQSKNLVDHVIVNKSHKQMLLMYKGQVVRKYWIALSDRPVGHKQFEGDKKTPEGRYILDYVKERSTYYKAFHISYPNKKDIEYARSRGRSPGGMIMVHGQPRNNSEYHDSVQRSDWTNGCIAILNNEIDEFISLVDPGTPITINP